MAIVARSEPEANLPPLELPHRSLWPCRADRIELSARSHRLIVATIAGAASSQVRLASDQLAVAAWLASAALGPRPGFSSAWPGRAGLLLARGRSAAVGPRGACGASSSAGRLPGLLTSTRLSLGGGAWRTCRRRSCCRKRASPNRTRQPCGPRWPTNGPTFATAICGYWRWSGCCCRCLAVHPLFWWLRRSVRLDQELLADAAAAGERASRICRSPVVWARSAQPVAARTGRDRHVGKPQHFIPESCHDPRSETPAQPGRSAGRGWRVIALLARARAMPACRW